MRSFAASTLSTAPATESPYVRPQGPRLALFASPPDAMARHTLELALLALPLLSLPPGAQHTKPAELLGPGGFQAHTMPDPWTPDCSLAVGRHHLVVAVNQRVRVFTKSGQRTFDQALVGPGAFLEQPSLLPNGSGAGDPVCVYDASVDRFFLVTLVRNPDMLTLSVTNDGNPNNGWTKHAIDMEPFGDIVDFPDLGFDAAALYVFARFENQSSAATRGKYCFAFDKAALLGGATPVPHATLFNDFFGSYTFAATRTLEPAPAQYFPWTRGLRGQVDRLRITAVQNALSTPILTEVNVAIPTWTIKADVPQAGTAVRLTTEPGNFYKHAVYRHGSLWVAHNGGVGPADRVLARWYEVRMNGWPSSGRNPTLAQSGEIDLGIDAQGAPISTIYPAIDVDAGRNVVLTFNRVSPNEPIALMQAVHRAADAAGVVSALHTLRTSASSHPDATHWVDYNTTQADPFEPGVFWGHGEYRTLQPATWISRLQVVP